jgi:hypothetical protein
MLFINNEIKIMKIKIKIIRLCFLFLYGLILYSCQKDEHIKGELGVGGMAKINVINAVVTGGNAKVNVSPKKMYWNSLPDNQVLGGFTLGRLFMVPADRSTVMQVAPVSDTTKIWYDNTSQLKSGKVYTLYLSGTPGDVKSLLHEEIGFPKPIIRDVIKPTPAADSIVNIRFTNLSVSVPDVDINLVGGGKVTGNLGYRQFTDFKAYPATSGYDYYTFEVRRSSDKELIATYDFPAYDFLFKSVVVFMMGIYDPAYELPLAYTDRYRIEAIAY